MNAQRGQISAIVNQAWCMFIFYTIMFTIVVYIMEGYRATDEKCGIPIVWWCEVFLAAYMGQGMMQIWIVVFAQFQATLPYMLAIQLGVPCLCLYFLMAWSIYGFSLNNSPLNNCNMVEVDQGWYSLMVFLLGIGVLCICAASIFSCVIPVLIIGLYNMNRGGGGSGSSGEALINSLGREKFDTTKYQYETSCQICLQDYKESDDVTKLKCNDKHYFHSHCIEDWIKSGHSNCPFCREQIVGKDAEEEDLLMDHMMDAPAAEEEAAVPEGEEPAMEEPMMEAEMMM